MRISSTGVDAVVLAGGVNSIPLYEGYAPGYKALLPLGDKLAIQYTLDILRAVPEVRRIAVVGPIDELRPALAEHGMADCDLVPGGDTIMDSIYNGLRHFADSPMVLMATADLPLITSQAVTDFLAGCSTVDLTYNENMFLSVVPEQYFTGAYANYPKAFNHFRDIAICHGNLFLVDPKLLGNTQATRRMNALYKARKSAVSSAMAIGLHIGLTYALGVHMWHLLSLAHMARIASKRFGFGLIPVAVEHPEITVDIDEPADYAFVTRQLGLAPAE